MLRAHNQSWISRLAIRRARVTRAARDVADETCVRDTRLPSESGGHPASAPQRRRGQPRRPFALGKERAVSRSPPIHRRSMDPCAAKTPGKSIRFTGDGEASHNTVPSFSVNNARCDGFGYSSRLAPGPAWFGAMDSGIHRASAPDSAWLGAMDSGIHRASAPDSACLGAMDSGIHT